MSIYIRMYVGFVRRIAKILEARGEAIISFF